MNFTRLPLFALGLLAGCAQTPTEILYTTAVMMKYRQCDELPATSYEQCIERLKERETEGRRDAEEEHARRQQEKTSMEAPSAIEQAMRDKERKR